MIFLYRGILMMSLLFLQGCGSSGFMLGSSKQQQYIPSETPYTKYIRSSHTVTPQIILWKGYIVI